jgi:DNA-binding response OmpR family regulator
MSRKSTKILLAAAEEETLMLLSFQLQRAGYLVSLAETEQEIIDQALDEKPEIVILDHNLQQSLGSLDICHRLHQAYPNLFIILMTTTETDSDQILGIEAEADDYLIKPFKPKDLVLRVQAILELNHPAASRRVAPAPSQSPTPTPQAQATPTPTPPPRNNQETPTPRLVRASPLTEKDKIRATIAHNLEATLQEASQAAQVQDIDHARQLYQQVLKLDPANENALMWLAWYTSDPYEGCSYLERLVAAHPENTKAQEFLEAGHRRLQELNQLISDSSVLGYWNVAEQLQQERIRKGIDRRDAPVQPVGQLLLRKGYINQEQLDTAVSLHEMFNRLGQPKKLGEILLEYGYLTTDQLQMVLNEQQAEYNSQFY